MPRVRRYRPGFDLRPLSSDVPVPQGSLLWGTGKTRMRRNPYHCPTLWILACGDVVFPAKAGNHVTPVRGALASSHHPLSDRRRLLPRGAPFLTFPPAGGKGHGGSGRAFHATPAPNRHPGSNLCHPATPLASFRRKPETTRPRRHRPPKGNQTSLKNHPNQTNHSSRPRRYPGMCGMGVTNLRSHP